MSSSSPTGTAGGPPQVRALVGAGVGDDQPLGRRHQRVEQHLAVLGARVAIADVGLGEQQVVAVAAGAAGKLAVVETENADDPVGNRAHRHERAHGEMARAEVRPRRASAEPVREQDADVRELELRARHARGTGLTGLRVDISEQSLKLAALPGVAFARGGERVGGLRDRVDPAADRFGLGERVGRCLHAVDELGEPPGEVDRAAVDVVERQHAAGRAACPARSSRRRPASGRGRVATCWPEASQA